VSSDPFNIAKDKQDRRQASGAAIAGAGATTAGVGAAAGGIPGTRPNFNAVFAADDRIKNAQGKGPRKAYNMARGAAPGVKATPGGILGFRISAHDLGTKYFRAQKELDDKIKKPSKKQSFYRGFNAGKIGPEESIMRGMARGQKGAHAALLGGAATTVYGVKRAASKPKEKVTKADDKRRSNLYNGTLVGAGTAGAAISHGGSKYLGRQQSKYAGRAAREVDEAGRLVPNIAGREYKKMSLRQIDKFKRANPGATDKDLPKSMYPTVKDGDIKRNPRLLSGVPKETAEQAGKLRGAAAQHRHFSEVFGSTAKVTRRFRGPSAIVAGVGAGGLAANRNKRVQKNYSAFGVEHG
jgi:hypothetical protein